jgi:hypothetical protein
MELLLARQLATLRYATDAVVQFPNYDVTRLRESQ